MQAGNGVRPSLMRQEIAQQPEALRATIDALLPRRYEVTSLAADTKAVLFIARGTSDNAAVYGSYLIQVHAAASRRWRRRRSRPRTGLVLTWMAFWPLPSRSRAAPPRLSRPWSGREPVARERWRSPTGARRRRSRRRPRSRS